jgi:soluble lytic murein transglycosylase-like protein
MTLRTDQSATLGYAAAVEERGTLADFFNRASEATPEAEQKESETPEAQAAKTPQQGPYASIIAKYAAMHGVPVGLAKAVVGIESNFRADARGAAGEVGLMQIKPATARAMGYSGSTKALYDPDTNIRFGMKYLGQAHQLAGGDLCGTILRYNAGHGAKRMNSISAAYCAKVKSKLGSS